MNERHDWEMSFPRETWPVYKCLSCGVVKCPTREELMGGTAPVWFDAECQGARRLSADDIHWLAGTGPYGQ